MLKKGFFFWLLKNYYYYFQAEGDFITFVLEMSAVHDLKINKITVNCSKCITERIQAQTA